MCTVILLWPVGAAAGLVAAMEEPGSHSGPGKAVADAKSCSGPGAGCSGVRCHKHSGPAAVPRPCNCLKGVWWGLESRWALQWEKQVTGAVVLGGSRWKVEITTLGWGGADWAGAPLFWVKEIVPLPLLL